MTACGSGWADGMDWYSRLVSLLKVALPLAALAILSTLFLLGRTDEPNATIPYSDAEIAERLRDQQMTGPFFTGTTANGDRIAFSAEKMTVQASGNAATGITAQFDLAGGGRILLLSDMGLLDIAAARAELSGAVDITSDAGLRVTSDAMTANLETGSLVSPGPIEARGPIGELTAGQMALQTSGGGGPAQLIFTNRVKLIYRPEETAGVSDP
ncbi:MAG: hypothetical protein AAGM84_02265 [Pseudomonadota bacterium]